MDYRTLTKLRQTLKAYASAVKNTSNKPNTPPVPAALRQAANCLPPGEIIRELGLLPHDITRLFVIREVCQPHALRHAALQSSLLVAPEYLQSIYSPRIKCRWYKALGLLIDAWQVLERESGDQSAFSRLCQLRKRVENVLPRKLGTSLPLATLLVTAEARLQTVKDLQHRIDDAAALLGKGQLAYSHDGLQEVVESLWAQIRSEYPALSKLTNERVEGAERDAIINRVEIAIAALREQYSSLIGFGFHLPGLEVARGKGREFLDEENEDEWEDAWEEPVKFDDLGDNEDANDASAERATAKPNAENDGIENFLKGKVGGGSVQDGVVLPPVTDWVAAVRGDEGDKMNRLLLDRLEEKAALETNGRGMISSFRSVESRERGMEKSRSSRRGKKTGTTARQRLSAALGIKKRKKKSLLDG